MQIKNNGTFDLTLVHPYEDVVDVFEFVLRDRSFVNSSGYGRI